jgi:hypothetical protein
MSKLLDTVVELALDLKILEDIRGLCDHVRSVQESSLQTFERLVNERRELIRLIRELKIKPPEALYHYGPDSSFKQWPGPIGVLRKHLGLPETEPQDWRTQEIINKQNLGIGTSAHSLAMAEAWMADADRLRKEGK